MDSSDEDPSTPWAPAPAPVLDLMPGPTRHRWSARLAGVLALSALPAIAVAVVVTSPDPEPDPATVLAEGLADEGLRAEVIECVLRLGGRDLRVGPLDEAARDELVALCRSVRPELAAADVDFDPPETLADVDRGPWTRGDDPALDELWAACEAGDGSACDRLFAEAPVGSAYEVFGLTCGDRPDVLDCQDLDRDLDAGATSESSP